MTRSLALVFALLSATPVIAQQNIDVSTVPPRDAVQLTIYNGADLTLVRERRTLTLRTGRTPLQFSWAGTLIDPTSVQIEFPRHGHAVDVLDTTYPHDKPQMLYWNVESATDGPVEAEISYFTSGVSWAADYVATTRPNELQLRLDAFVRVTNHSGAEFTGAQVRLVVGEINLVETVRSLAQRGMISQAQSVGYRLGADLNGWDDDARDELMVALGDRLRDVGQGSSPTGGSGGGGAMPPEIIKEGLSEYFIYTIEGAQTIPNGWSKALRLFEGAGIENDIRYRYRPLEYGDQLVRVFVVPNDESHELGTTPLPNGTIRVFRDNGRGGLGLLGTTHSKYVPIGEDIEMNLGPDPLVRHERMLVSAAHSDFWFSVGDTDHLVDLRGAERLQQALNIVGWSDHEHWVERIVNDRDTPVAVEIRRRIDGDVTIETAAQTTMHDYRTPQFTGMAPARARYEATYGITMRQGTSHEQDRVELKTR